MDLKQEEFLESSEVRTLKVTAELSFFRCLKGGFDPHTVGKLSEQAERVRAACLEASLSDEIISDILAKARHSAHRRFTCCREVFVAASITGGREALPFVKFAVKFLEDKKYRVPSLHNAADDPVATFVQVVGDSQATNGNAFRDANYRWIEECGLFMAELGTPSHGVGSEWEHCLVKPKLNLPLTPMLGFYMEDRDVSPHITGISEEEARYIWFRSYRSEEDLAKTISEFLAEFS